MLRRPRVCRDAGVAKVPLITARRPADLGSNLVTSLAAYAAPERVDRYSGGFRG
jgi:hypothetical protein